jgi:hypothetical protein
MDISQERKSETVNSSRSFSDIIISLGINGVKVAESLIEKEQKKVSIEILKIFLLVFGIFEGTTLILYSFSVYIEKFYFVDQAMILFSFGVVFLALSVGIVTFIKR